MIPRIAQHRCADRLQVRMLLMGQNPAGTFLGFRADAESSDSRAVRHLDVLLSSEGLRFGSERVRSGGSGTVVFGGEIGCDFVQGIVGEAGIGTRRTGYDATDAGSGRVSRVTASRRHIDVAVVGTVWRHADVAVVHACGNQY